MFATVVRTAAGAAALALLSVPALTTRSTPLATVATGIVRDGHGHPVEGATVAIRTTRSATTTSTDGRYRLEVPAEAIAGRAFSIVVRRIGYESIVRKLEADRSTVRGDFTLVPVPIRHAPVIVKGPAASTDGGAPGFAKALRRAILRDKVSDEAVPASAPAPEAAAARADMASGMVSESRVRSRVAAGGSRTASSVAQEPRPGILTAAVWDDAQRWAEYRQFLDRAAENGWNTWGLDSTPQATITPARLTRPVRAERRAIDLGFLVDATGSMGDEMQFLQSELKNIVRRVRATEPNLDIRVSMVFYRDRGDEFVTKSLPFTTNIDDVVKFIAGTTADGGGDFPEDMNAGLDAMMHQAWSRDAIPQMLFVIADAPPQQYAGADYTYHEAIGDAAAKGLAIFPVAASGVDKPTEFLFRAMAVRTGGKYVFLTDDSGVGNPHERPDVSDYTVEKLNDLMVREIRSFVSARVGGRSVADTER